MKDIRNERSQTPSILNLAMTNVERSGNMKSGLRGVIRTSYFSLLYLKFEIFQVQKCSYSQAMEKKLFCVLRNGVHTHTHTVITIHSKTQRMTSLSDAHRVRPF